MHRVRVTATIAGAAALALALTACGSKKDTSTGAGNSSATTSAFKGCMVTDTGGIDDKTFNASAWKGMQDAQATGKATVSYVQSKAETDYTTNISSYLAQKCGIIVTVGGLMGKATADAAKANPSQKFMEVDSAGNGTNVKGLQYNTAQGAFLAGYLAAAYSKTGVVATYGGLPIDPVKIYMDGFYEGVQYYNQKKSKSVELLGWNEKTQTGTFAGSFGDIPGGQRLATNFVNSKADVIFPVAGGTGLGTAAYAKSSGKASVIWVDVDGCTAAAQYCSVFLNTAFKDMINPVTDNVVAAAGGTFDASKDYLGNLANKGTGLAGYHDFDSKVDATTKSELDAIAKDIESGTIKITSPAAAKLPTS